MDRTFARTRTSRPIRGLALLLSLAVLLGAVSGAVARAQQAEPLEESASPPTEAPEPPAQGLSPEQTAIYRDLLARVTSDSSEERLAAIRDLGRARPRLKAVAQLLRRFAWQSERPAESEAAKAALADMGVELGHPPEEHPSWLRQFSAKTVLLTVRGILESLQTPNPDRDMLDAYDRRLERQRELSEIGVEPRPR